MGYGQIWSLIAWNLNLIRRKNGKNFGIAGRKRVIYIIFIRGGDAKRLEFESKFISRAIVELYGIIQSTSSDDPHALLFAERFLELLIDLEAQLPTRRFFHTLLLDHCVITTLRHSVLFERESKKKHSLFVKLFNRLEFYLNFQIDEITGLALPLQEISTRHHSVLASLQKKCFASSPEVFEEFIFSSISALSTRKSLLIVLDKLSDEAIVQLAKDVGIRIHDIYSKNQFDRSFIQFALVDVLVRGRGQLESINKESLFPNEVFLILI